MRYDFDTPVNRRGTGSMKWNVAEHELPMWVADMDFKTAPEIIDVIRKRADHGVFGYSVVSDEWYQAITDWWKRRYGFLIEKEWLLFCSGVVPAISSIVRKLTCVNENVIVQTPVYNIFFNSIINNGRRVLESPLMYDGEAYDIDFQDLEQKLADPQTTMLILCNPHNPIGKIWSRDTLERIGELCWKHHVLVVSDEIHCDLTAPGRQYVPFASVSEKCRTNSITCIAPTKAFNLAGIQTSAVIVPDERLRHRVNRGLNTDEVAEPNAFAVSAAVAAFTQGEPWLNELREYLQGNKHLVNDYLKEELPTVKAVVSEATYLVWLDCKGVLGCASELSQFLRDETGLYLSDGRQYGQGGQDFLRMNIACPCETVRQGLARLKRGVMAYEKRAADSC